MFGYYISHILHTAITQFDRILIKYFMIYVMFKQKILCYFKKPLGQLFEQSEVKTY